MLTFSANLERALEAPRNIPAGELAGMILCEDEGAWEEAFAAAREVKDACGRSETLYRGLLECSNVCSKDCYYCGIRRSNAIGRYRMGIGDVGETIERIRKSSLNAVALQGGELENEENTSYYEKILGLCEGLEVTLSLGEQEESVYRRWREAGAMRYLLRIETSNRTLYGQLHPREHSFDRRVECIRTLKRLGYVTGTGVMTGLPGQTAEDLAADILFFGEMDADMVGMGPWIPHPLTPLAKASVPPAPSALKTALKMIALARLYLHNVNIVSSTALGALGGMDGIESGLRAGANVVMPNFTPRRYRESYELYPGKSEMQIG